MTRDPRVDDYIARQADFARPILDHLRELMHAACPEVEETLKWSAPAFTYGGEILAGMMAFKAHATFGFWRGEDVTGASGKGAMGSFGRITSVDDLPSEADFAAYVAKARALIDSGEKKARPLKHARPALEMPDDFAAALAENPAAQATYDGFPPSCRREYLEWVTEAKRPETRHKRLAQAVEWMAEGKRRNWKYENC